MREGHWLFTTGLLALVLLSASPSARSLELTSSAQLAAHCQALAGDWGGPDGRFCDAYLRGFVDGSPHVSIQQADARESFTERAVRTRLGRPVSTRPKYCIANNTTVRDLAAQLLAQAREAPPRDDTDASVLIYAVLARYHPCSR